MMDENKILLFLVDDDALFLKSLEIEFTDKTESIIKTFPTGELCLENISQNPDVIILDYHLNGIDKKAINGLETLDRIKTANQTIPVVMLSSQDKIEVAVNCMKHQAFDYIVKSETAFIRLQKTITTIFHYQKIEKALSWYMEKMRYHHNQITKVGFNFPCCLMH
jgi:two-component system OmpR family response regulator